MPDISASTWNESDPQNNATPPTGWPEGQMPSTVNDCSRMMMGGLKRWWNRANPTISATGASGAYAYATANTLFPTAYQQGETYSFKAPFTSVGGDTFVVNALTALPIYSRTGSGGLSAIVAGDIQINTYVTLAYDSALNSGAGGFQLLGGSSAAPINNPSFGGTVTAPTINVTGTGTIQNLVVPGTSTQTGAVLMGSTLHVAGATTLSGGNTVTGNESVSGNLTAGGNITADASVYTNGNFYGPAAGYSLLAPGNVNAAVIDLWANTTQMLGSATVSGTLTAGTVIGNGSVQSNGVYFENNGGWFYTPQGLWCANINTGSINMNGAALSGCGNIAGASVGSIGGVAMPGGGTLNCGQLNSGNISSGALNTNGNPIDSGSVNSHGAAVVTGHCYPQYDDGYYCGVGSLNWIAVYSYAYPGPSGRELKTDIVDAPAGALEQVLALRTVKFRWKSRPDDKLHHGFIADEAAAVLGRDFGGYENREGRESLDKTEMVCVLWQAVQELTARLEALEAR